VRQSRDFFESQCVFVFCMNVFFCYVRFSFCSTGQDIGGKNVSEVTYFVLSGTRSGSLVCCRRAWRNCDVCKNM